MHIQAILTKKPWKFPLGEKTGAKDEGMGVMIITL
jgi:hypothetical protein